jgi:nucleotidyltransferase substrate binding protein (TIGR01987 family)
MKPENDIRWRQRFQNYIRAFKLLRHAMEDKPINEYSELEKEGIIQRFEYTFELGWKTWKDYLEYSGINLEESTPRKVIKECTSRGIFAAAEINPEAYMNMMLERNALSYMYDFERFNKALVNIKENYLPELERQYNFLLDKEHESNEE